MSETPRIVVTVAAPVEAVREALRDKEKIRHWHGWEYEGAEGGLDQEIDVIYFNDSTRDDPDWDAYYYDDVTEGWTTFLHQLRFALDRHRDEPRRTLFYSGIGTDSFNLPDLPAGRRRDRPALERLVDESLPSTVRRLKSDATVTARKGVSTLGLF
ncbi:hypothetical protein [Kribbella sp. DT2]|uniref:hypothetical protein n=1 Tax=Kribbella sp. DT2 TaxID=3393427 RepID=UPI003CF7A233